MISERYIEQVLNRADIVDVVERNMGALGRGMKACCPFHQERTPSFHVNARTQTWHCFGGCPQGDNGGDVISFVMKYKHLAFPEAVRDLAKLYGITIEETRDVLTAKEIEARQKREAMLLVNEWASLHYSSALYADNAKAKFALNYAVERRGWGAEYVAENGIGYADRDRSSLYAAAIKAGQPIDLMVELGLLRRDDHGEVYDFYRDRLMIPIRDRFRRTIGFTARALGESKAKYINSPTSAVYEKKQTIFGIDNAISAARKEDLFYLVEGAPDVMKLQSLGIANTVASLGGTWSEAHFSALQKHANRVCFIPDADVPKRGEAMGAGKRFVCSNGKAALKAGLGVTVKEIPMDTKEKRDPDSYITSGAVLRGLEERDFIVWYAELLFAPCGTVEAKSGVVSELTGLLAMISDEVKVQMLLKQLQRLYPDKALWKGALTAARKSEKEANVVGDKAQLLNRELLKKYGFYEDGNCYYSLAKDGEMQWSNFVMEPMFHIKDPLLPKRLYRITNYRGVSEIIELKQEELASLGRFKQKVEGIGNFIWLAKEEHLTKLKMYLYEKTETAVEVTQLGWNVKGFFAFGNGCFYSGRWHPTDDYGIVRLGQGVGNYYLPGNSKIYRENQKLFAFERRFVHLGLNGISLADYSQKLIEVFGDNGKVGLCFLLATLFRDVVAGVTKSFPILNLFGPVGSGKSELGHSLMSFFIIDNTPPNIQNSTVPAMGDIVAQCSNALVHIDEYKNGIDYLKIEFLKGLWDGSGRTRMNWEDKKREITSVDCGVILSGQEMPTADIALFTRVLFLTFNQSVFSDEAKRRFEELKKIRKRGLTHLTLELLRHRAKFESEFVGNYNTALSDLVANTRGEDIQDRILRNWGVVLGAMRTLSGVVDMPFGYGEMLKICVEHAVVQNSECHSNNELATFWNVVAFLHQDGQIYMDGDFKVKYMARFKCDDTNVIEWGRARPVLLLRKNRLFMLYKRNGKQVGSSTLPAETLSYYLENSKEYIGVKRSVRFKNIIDGRRETTVVKDEHGEEKLKPVDSVDRAMCFDYELVREHFGINLEVVASDGGDDDFCEVRERQSVLPLDEGSE
jgi:DNA primase catalytic core